MWVRQAPKNFKEKGTCPSITLWCAIKAGKNRLCVKASATTLCVRRGISLTILALTNSLTKYRQISMCQENFRRTGFSLIAIQVKLSFKDVSGCRLRVSKIAECFAQIHYFLGCLAGYNKFSLWGRKKNLILSVTLPRNGATIHH